MDNFTYFFTHFDPFHILFNMLALYWFGKLVEEYLGNKRVLNLYMLGGLMGGLFYLLLFNFVPFFHEQALGRQYVMVGASGSVYAIVLGAATLMPNYTFMVFLIGPVRIKWIALFFIVLSFFQISAGSNVGGNLAHLGGAFFGFLYISQLKKGTDLAKPFGKMIAWFKNVFKPKPKLKVTYRKEANAPGSATYPSDDEVDKILDKIKWK
ncbi:MAG: rhomboid family intramembrane serine protease [Bacteroidetes bacterium]|nr:rhomboid family intramembrane serine protease [Bacteroidota bacterium]